MIFAEVFAILFLTFLAISFFKSFWFELFKLKVGGTINNLWLSSCFTIWLVIMFVIFEIISRI